MFKWCMKKNQWFSFDQNAPKHQKPQISKNAKILEKCMKTCNLMKKKGQKCLTLVFWRKPLDLWPRKMTKKIFGEKGWREESERKTRNSLKIWSDSYMFEKIQNSIGREESGRDRNVQKNRLDWSKRIGKESSKPETLSLKAEFFSSLFDRSKNRLNRSNPEETEILKILENFLCKNTWKTVFMIWDVCLWFQMFYKTKLFKEKFKL